MLSGKPPGYTAVLSDTSAKCGFWRVVYRGEGMNEIRILEQRRALGTFDLPALSRSRGVMWQVLRSILR